MSFPILINRQPPEPRSKESGAWIDLVNIFHTIQGEGPFTGHPAVFIRLAGCNLQCPGCDTDYTTDREIVPVSKIVREVEELLDKWTNTKLVIITGGEPLRQSLVSLVSTLILHCGVHVQIESNGVYAPTELLVNRIKAGELTYVVSPKTNKISAVAAQSASCFKYVLEASNIVPEDGLPREALRHKAKPFVARPPKDYKGLIYVNPMDSTDAEVNRKNLIACRDSAIRFGYIMGIQLHKLIDLP